MEGNKKASKPIRDRKRYLAKRPSRAETAGLAWKRGLAIRPCQELPYSYEP